MELLLKEIVLPLLHKPGFYLAIAIAIVLFSKSARAHINTRDIIGSYCKDVLKDHHLTGSFVIAPVFMAIAISLAYSPDSESINYIVTSVSIRVSMFFWSISFFADYRPQSQNASQCQAIENIIAESKKIVNFEILESVFLLLLSMLFPIIKSFNTNNIPIMIYSVLLYFCFINLILNLLVLIKKHNAMH